MNKPHILSLAFMLSMVLFFTTAQAQNLGVYPTTLDFKLAAGQSEAQTISISNNSGERVQFRIYLNDWSRDSTGGHVYSEPASTPRSCAKWINLDKNFVELQPGESTKLTIQMVVPANLPKNEMKWGMLFIESVQEAVAQNDQNAQATVRNLLRVGVHIYETPPGLSDKGIKVVDMKANPEIPNAYDLICQNTGNVMIECKAHLELNNTNGETTKLDFVEFPMFPDQKRYVTFELPKNLPNGKYNALGILDAGEDLPLEAVEGTVEMKTVTAPKN